jgi:ABC-2 type transport system ATP-binding protein
MSGLDPLGSYQIREIIISLKKTVKTIFLNTHILSEVEQVCDRIAILAKGEIICAGFLNELLGTENTYDLKGQGGDRDVLNKRILNLQLQPDGTWHGVLPVDYYDFIASLRLMGGKIIQMNLTRQSLEEFFIQQVQKQNQNQ